MPDLNTSLRNAGFNDEEIGQYLSSRREQLQTAGFDEKEIDSYFGLPKVPGAPPASFIDRLARGAKLAREITQIPGSVAMMNEPVDTTIENLKSVKDRLLPKSIGGQREPSQESTLESGKQFGELVLGVASLPFSPIQGAFRALIGNPMVFIDEAMRHGAVKLYGEDKVARAEKAAGREPGPMTYGQAKSNVDLALMGISAPKVMRAEFGPTGKPTITPIGPAPEAHDVLNAGNTLTRGDTTPVVEDKLVKLYEDRGIHPAEVAHDAQTDPTITQSMVSADPFDYPDAYQFHGYEPTEKTLSELEANRAHLDVTLKKTPVGSLEPYFENVPAGGRPKTANPIMPGGGEIEHPTVGGGEFDIKPMREPADQSLIMPQGKTEIEYTDAEKSVLSKINIGEKSPTRALSWDRLYTNFIDKMFPISKAVKKSGLELTAEENPYQRARLLTGYVGKADHFLNQGTFDFETYANNGPSLKDILNPVKDDLNGFRAYAAAARAMELESRGIESGFATAGETSAPPLVSTGLDAARTVLSEGAARYEKPLRDLVDYQNRVSGYLRDSGVLSDAGYKAMLEANKRYVPFSRVMGIDELSPTRGGSSLQAHNPINTIEGSARDIVDPIESIVRNTYHSIEMAERNVVGTKLVDMLKRSSEGLTDVEPAISDLATKDNPRAAEIAKALDEVGVKRPDELAQSLAHAAEPTKAGEIAILRDGKRETYKVDPDLARAMKGLDAQSMGMLERILSIPASTLRAGAIINPDFALRHTIRDYLYAFATQKDGAFSPADMARGFSGLMMKDADYWNWLKGGGGNISYVGMDRRYLQADIRKLTADTGLAGRAWNVLADPEASMWGKAGSVGKLPFQAVDKFVLDPLRTMVMFAENASHLGAFKKAMRSTTAPPDNLRAQIIDAAWKSRDTAVDAMRMGASMRAYNMITAFANIKLQDTDRIVRAIKDNPVSSLTKIGAAITVPSVILWGLNHDDPDYQEIPQWEKDLFFIVPVGSAPPSPLHVKQAQERGTEPTNSAKFFMRLPKPWAMGMIFGSLPERLLDEFVAKKPGAFDEFFKSLYTTSGPDFVPTAAAPIIDQFANRSTFTNRTLIPSDQEKYLPEYQYTPYTTELTKSLGKIIGAFPGISELKMDNSGFGGTAKALTSPILIENYIRGWSGTLGMYALNAADTALRKTGQIPDPIVPTSTLADMPVIKAFVVRYPTATTESIQKFNDEYAKYKIYFDTYMSRAKEGDQAAMQHVADMGGPIMFARLDGIKEVLAQHSKMISDIYKNPEVPADEKRQLIDTLYFNMIQIGQYGRQAFRDIHAQVGGR